MKNLITVIICTFILISSIEINAQPIWNLRKCIDYALENNIQIKQQGLNTDYSKIRLSQAKSNRLPDLNAQLSNDYSFGRSLTYENTYSNVNSTGVSAGIGTNLTLFNGFILKNTIEQREIDLQASLKDLEKAKDDVTLTVAGAYLEILFAEELKLVSEANIGITKKQIERTQQLVDAGSVAKGALLEIQAQLAREELQYVNDKNREQLAYLNLFQLLELPVAESFKIEKPKLPEIGANLTMTNSLEVFQNAINTRPEIAAARLRVKSMQKQIQIAKGARYPNLGFGANYYNNYNDNYVFKGKVIPFVDQLKNNERYGFGFRMNIPIFNRNQIKNNISSARLQLIENEYRLQTSSNALRKEIEQAYTNALAALNRFRAGEKAVSSMAEAFRYNEEKFNVGMINTVEYNQSKNNLAKAQSELLQSKYAYLFRAKILDFYNGVPITL